MENFEIRADIKFLIKLNWKHIQIIKALQYVWGDSVSYRAVVYDSNKWFKEWRVQLDDDSRGGKPTTARNQENISLVQNLVQEQDWRVTTKEIANEVGIAHGLAFSILTENLGLSKLSVGTMGSQIVTGTKIDQKSWTFFNNFGEDESKWG